MEPVSLDKLLASVGHEVGVAPWRVVSQTMIDQFADATDDHQFIHCDPERAMRETPFGEPGVTMTWTPEHIEIADAKGRIIDQRDDGRGAFDRRLEGHWDQMNLAYFNGYARWTYLTTPFFMAMPGFHVTEIEPWKEGSEIWRGLRVRFPPSIASHSAEQEFYFGPDLLLRRHDYRLEIGGGVPIAQYVHDIVEADGFGFRPSAELFPGALGRNPSATCS